MTPISFTFTGRTQFMKLLVPYLLREREASGLAKHIWFLHTNNQADIDFAVQTTKDHPGFFEVLDTGIRPNYHTHLYHTAYKHFTQPGQIYVKLDDDICFIEKGALGRLAKFKQDNPEYFLALANTVNNGICAHLHQKFGALRAPDVFWWKQDNNTDIINTSPTGEASMCRIHQSFFENWESQQLDLYKFYKWVLWPKAFWFSINMFAVTGDDLKMLGHRLDHCTQSDERFLTEVATEMLNKVNCIYGDALVAHYSFRIQNRIIDRHPELLARYGKICAKETGLC